jgi:hypothetical protein
MAAGGRQLVIEQPGQQYHRQPAKHRIGNGRPSLAEGRGIALGKPANTAIPCDPATNAGTGPRPDPGEEAVPVTQQLPDLSHYLRVSSPDRIPGRPRVASAHPIRSEQGDVRMDYPDFH